MVDLKNDSSPTPKKAKLSMSSVKNWLLSDKKTHDNIRRPRMQDSLLRSIRRKSLRLKRVKSLSFQEKRKSGKHILHEVQKSM